MTFDEHGLPHADPPGPDEWVPKDPPDHSWLEVECDCGCGDPRHRSWVRRLLKRLAGQQNSRTAV